jgi:hypothetical protein
VLCISLYLFLCYTEATFKKKIQAREKEVYGRKAKEKEIEKRQENKIKGNYIRVDTITKNNKNYL